MFPKGLFGKLLLFTVLTIVLVILIATAITIRQETISATRSLLQESSSLAQVVSSEIEAGYLSQRWPFETLRRVSEAESILYWWVVEPNGKVHLASSPEMWGKTITDPAVGTEELMIKDGTWEATGERIKVIVNPLRIGEGGRPWTFWLGISLRSIAAAKRGIVLANVGVGLLLIAIGAGLSFLLARGITRPIRRLVEGTRSIARGELGHRVEVKGKDELSELARSFNEMSADLKRSHEDLELERNRLAAILSSAEEAIMMFDLEGRLLFANESFERLFGLAPKVRGDAQARVIEGMAECFADRERFESIVRQLFQDPGLVTEEEFELVKPRERTVRGYSAPVRGEDGRPIGRLMVCRDITREKEVDRLKTEFISAVSHELRTPLTSIKGYAELLLEGDSGELNEEQREFLRIIADNSAKLAELIDDLLDVQRIESGRLELELEELRLDELLRGVAEAFRAAAEEKGLMFEVEVAEGLTIRADRERLAQALSNLISNAIKYTEEGSVRVRMRRVDRKAMIEVEDTGIGMDQEEVEQLFTRFFQADGGYTRRAGGTGLGLFIAKAIVDEHDGEISVESELGVGSRFTVLLPLSLQGEED